MPTSLKPIAILACLLLCSCSVLMVKSSVKEAHTSLVPSSTREQVHRILGTPCNSHFFHTPRAAVNVIPNSPHEIAKTLVSGFDDFVVSGLVHTEPYTEGTTGDAAVIYSFATVATGGLFELFATPAAAMNLLEDKKKQLDVRVWYDVSRHYLAHKSKERE